MQAALSVRYPDPVADLSSAIKRFQRFAGLPETGVIDNQTRSVMSLSRCGVPDTDRDYGPHQRHKRFVLAGSPWPTRNLKYYFRNFTRHLTPSALRSVVKTAAKLWSDVSPLMISETLVSSDAQIRLQYSTRHHGDNFPFDGVGGVLAHAFYPHSGALAGEVHFDDDERWTQESRDGTNIKQVTTHEIGHALGLGHSNEPGSVMSPFYSGYSPQFRLGNDDILGIRKLYDPDGQVTESSAAVTSADITPTSRPDVQPCHNAAVDAATAFRATTYFFKGTSYIVVDNSTGLPTIRNGYPRPLRADWPSLASVERIDAALYVPAQSDDTAHLYLFKDDRYWRFSSWPTTNQLDAGYPRLIRDGFPGVPNNLDAAFVWGKRRRIYFVKGSQYYRYTRKLGVHADYPKPLSLWRGLPTESSISAAFQAANAATYFFTGQHFYRFNDVAFNVDNRQPLSTAEHWFGCSQRTAEKQ